MPSSNRRSLSSGAIVLLAVVVVVATLRLAREIFIPFALAILFSFLLAPLVTRLMRWHVPKAPAVIVVVLFAFSIIGAVGALMASQGVDLAGKLPEYQQNIRRKVQSLAPRDGGLVGYVERHVEELRKGLTGAPPAEKQSAATGRDGNPAPAPVEVHVSQFSPMKLVSTVIGSIAGVVLTAFVVIIFVVFMLGQREDLRDRIIRLGGTGKLNLTTKLLDDASRRVSRYLLGQLIVNVGYGLAISIGLLLIGVPNPFLWGLLTALLRYIPYAGTWVAASMPFALALAVDSGWMKPLLVLGLWVVCEIIVSNFVEPFVYGVTGGITPLAVLAAAVFWAWVWGPVGLLLSTPLTVCLVSMGRYVPSLEFLSVLLGDEPPLSPADRFYQRLLAHDEVSTEQLAEEFLEKGTLESLYDTVVLPALARAEEDRRAGRLEQRRYRFVLQATRGLLGRLEEAHREDGSDREPGHPTSEAPGGSSQGVHSDTTVVCVPARGRVDSVVAVMLTQLLERRGFVARVLRPGAIQSEKDELEKQLEHEISCLSGMGSTALADISPVLDCLQRDFSHAPVLVGVWGGQERINELSKRFAHVPRENFVTTLKQAVDRAVQLAAQREDHSHAHAEVTSPRRF